MQAARSMCGTVYRIFKHVHEKSSYPSKKVCFHANYSVKHLFLSLPSIRGQWTKHAYTYLHRKLYFLSTEPHLSLLSYCIFSQQILSIRTPCDTLDGIRSHRHFHMSHSLVCRLQVAAVQNIEELK